MSDHHTSGQDRNPPDPDDSSQSASAATTAPDQRVERSRWASLRDRFRGIGRRTVAGLLVGLVLGGVGGFAVGAVASGDADHPGAGHHGRPFDDEGGERGRGGFAPPGPGQLPPSTAPEEGQDSGSGDLRG